MNRQCQLFLSASLVLFGMNLSAATDGAQIPDGTVAELEQPVDMGTNTQLQPMVRQLQVVVGPTERGSQPLCKILGTVPSLSRWTIPAGTYVMKELNERDDDVKSLLDYFNPYHTEFAPIQNVRKVVNGMNKKVFYVGCQNVYGITVGNLKALGFSAHVEIRNY